MSAGWVAASVRARAMARRRLGPDGARRLATAPGLDAALGVLAGSTYGHDVRPGTGLGEAQRAVVATLVWNLRVLAGWCPREGVTVLRVLAAPVEVGDVVDRAEAMAGRPAPAPYALGALAGTGPDVRAAGSPDDLRRALARSSWGDPGDVTPRAVALTMGAAAADRVVALVPEAAAWAAGQAALVLAREILLDGRPVPAVARTLVGRVLGPAAPEAATLADLRRVLPTAARWALPASDDPADLWRGERHWWQTVEDEAARLLRHPTPGRQVLVGAAALGAVDAWRVRGALELADRGGTDSTSTPTGSVTGTGALGAVA